MRGANNCTLIKLILRGVKKMTFDKESVKNGLKYTIIGYDPDHKTYQVKNLTNGKKQSIDAVLLEKLDKSVIEDYNHDLPNAFYM
jgi:hypothetical protein